MSDPQVKAHIEVPNVEQCRQKRDELLHCAELLQPGLARQTVLLEAARYQMMAAKSKSVLAPLD